MDPETQTTPLLRILFAKSKLFQPSVFYLFCSLCPSNKMPLFGLSNDHPNWNNSYIKNLYCQVLTILFFIFLISQIPLFIWQEAIFWTVWVCYVRLFLASNLVLRGMDILFWISVILTKGNNFVDYMFAFVYLYKECLWWKGLLLTVIVMKKPKTKEEVHRSSLSRPKQ